MTWRRYKQRDAVSDYDVIQAGSPVHGRRPPPCGDCQAMGADPWRHEAIVREGSNVTHFRRNPPQPELTLCGRYLVVEDLELVRGGGMVS